MSEPDAQAVDPFEVDQVYFVFVRDALLAAHPDISPDYLPSTLKKTVHCYLVLKSGRVIIGENACFSRQDDLNDDSFDEQEAKKSAEASARFLLEQRKLIHQDWPEFFQV